MSGQANFSSFTLMRAVRAAACRAAALVFPVAPLLLIASGASAQQVHTVGGVFADFSELQPAINAAQDGDVLLIVPGFFSSHATVTDKSLVIAALDPAGARPTIGSLAIEELSASRTVVLRGVDIFSLLQAESLRITDCDGAVLIEDCHLLNFLSTLPPTVAHSPHVSFARCTLTGASGGMVLPSGPALVIGVHFGP